MNEKNILSLKARLMQLGFEPSVETLLRCNICFKVPQFELVNRRLAGSDQYCFSVQVEKGENELYLLKYYTATLQKKVFVPAELENLDRLMETVDWKQLVTGREAAIQIDHAMIRSASDILQGLQVAGVGAELLRYKHWVGTSLESMIQQLSALRSEWEISERFYFFDETGVISFDDAVRFLGSKWMEKQLNARKKLLVKRTVSEKSGGGVAGGKLLAKNPRRINRRSVDKNM